jgi:hypothetical protein
MRFSRTEGSSEERFAIGGFLGRHFRKVARQSAYYFKRYGWKVGLLIFTYYLVRDTILYILLPLLIAKEIIGGSVK